MIIQVAKRAKRTSRRPGNCITVEIFPQAILFLVVTKYNALGWSSTIVQAAI